MIPQTKIGNCSRCPKKNTRVKNRGKDLICLVCCKKEDSKKQWNKQKSKVSKGQQSKIRRAGWEQDITLDEKKLSVSNAAAMKRWFADRRAEMKGTCSHCGEKTLKHNDKMYHYCIAHILPKAYFKSVATHPLNWIELCFYGNSCHTNFDNYMIDLIELNCWDEVVTKFVSMYPSIAPEERRRIPNVLLQYVEVEK